MKHVRIILASGKEVSFVADDKFQGRQCMDTSTYVSPNGPTYSFIKTDVSAMIVTPMMQCPHCGKWIIPVKDRWESECNRVKTTETVSICPECGKPL